MLPDPIEREVEAQCLGGESVDAGGGGSGEVGGVG